MKVAPDSLHELTRMLETAAAVAQRDFLLGKQPFSSILFTFFSKILTYTTYKSFLLATGLDNDPPQHKNIRFWSFLEDGYKSQLDETLQVDKEMLDTNLVAQLLINKRSFTPESAQFGSETPDWLSKFCTQTKPVQAWILLPLVLDRECIGVIVLFSSGQCAQQLPVDWWSTLSDAVAVLVHRYMSDMGRHNTAHELYCGTQQKLEDLLSEVCKLTHELQSEGALRHNTEEKLKEAQQNLEKAIEEKNLVIMNLSHDLRTPLNCIIGVQDLLRYTPLSNEQKDYVNMIGRSATLLLGLINDILEFSRTEKWRTLENKDFDLRTCVEEVFEICSLKGQEKNLEMVNIFDTNFPDHVSVVGDCSRVNQILFNLVSNAVKFTSTGCVVLKTMVDSFVPGGVIVRFEVRDTGIGIDKRDMKKIGTPFVQFSHSFEGSGLGLSICKTLVHAMKGTFKVDSVLGEGSTFIISLPFQTMVRSPSPNSVHPQLTSFHVLIVDKQQRSAQSLKHIVENLGAIGHVVHSLEAPTAHNCWKAVFVDHSLLLGNLDTLKEFEKLIKFSQPECILVVTAPYSNLTLYQDFNTLAKPYKLQLVTNKLWNLKNQETPVIPVEHLGVNKVLVVDDNPVNVKVLSHMLSKMNIAHDVAVNGEDAVQKSSKHHYDLIFMDLMMPIKDGYQATSEIRKMGETCRIVALTAKAMQHSDVDTCKKVGMDDCLSKPISFSRLNRYIHRISQYSTLDPLVRRRSAPM